MYSDTDPRHITNVINAFVRFDANNSGKLDYRELRAALRHVGMRVVRLSPTSSPHPTPGPTATPTRSQDLINFMRLCRQLQPSVAARPRWRLVRGRARVRGP